MKIAAIIQARMGSTRLPGKVMKDISGKPMLQHIIERLTNCQLINEIIIAIAQEKNKSLLHLTLECGAKSFMGNVKDVLDRYYQAAKKHHVDVIVRITSDCPLIDPGVVDKVIAFYLRNRFTVDYVSNRLKPSYPRGLDTEVYSFQILREVWEKAKDEYQREHVTPFIYEHPEMFRLANVGNGEDLSYMRWTVDEEKDLEFVRKIYKGLYKEGEIFVMEDILALLAEKSQLLEINKKIKQRKLRT